SYFMWHMGSVERGMNSGPYAEAIQKKNSEQKEKGKNGFQRAGNVQGYIARMLYRELKRRIISKEFPS
ncbi:MAG: hypothetical protein AAFZ49_10760, partial [Cyanobacteria bacterium J06659_2]